MPDRKRPIHLLPGATTGRCIVFVTVCTKNRQRVLANDNAHNAIQNDWTTADAWRVGKYVLMPDHLHFFAAPVMDIDLATWIRFWKSQFTRQFGEAVWQSDYWDRQLRSSDSYEEKWNYVANNPVRHGLVPNAGDWRYQGELNSLP